MKNKKIHLYIIAILVIIVATTTLKLVNNPNREEIKQVNEINEKAGPMQISEEYLGPNQNTPITPIENE